MPDSPQDVHKKSLGRKGEKLAEKYLKSAGYKILQKITARLSARPI